MLKLEPDYWHQEIEAAKTYRDQFLDEWDSQIRRFTGPGFKNDHAPTIEDDTDLENHAFEWVSLMVQQIASSNPSVRIRTTRPGPAQQGALALQYAINRWIRLVNLQATNESLVTDYALRYCIAAVFPAPAEGMISPEEPSLWPVVRRISPRRFLQDPKAIDGQQIRWQAHLVLRDKEDVIKEAKENPKAGWDVDALEAIGTVRSDDAVLHVANPERDVDQVDREQIAYWEVYCPELQVDPKKGPEKGYNGSILTLGVGETQGDKEPQTAWLRKPRPYFGRRGGLYHVCGAYVVPDEALPLSPTVAVQAQAEHLNAVARAAMQMTEDYKRIAIVGQQDPGLEQLIATGRHGHVYTTNVEDIGRNVVQLELGGVTAQILAQEDRARQSLDRNSGIPEAMRGNVEGGATATEIAAATGGATARFAHHIEKFRRFQIQILRAVAWHLEFNDSIKPFSLGQEAVGNILDPDTGLPLEQPWIRPGLAKGQKMDDFDDHDFEIDVHSMSRTSEEQSMALAAELDDVVINIGSAMTNPGTAFHVNWEEYLRKRAETRGVPDYTKYFDFDRAREVAALLLQTQAPPPPEKKIEPQTRLVQDISGANPGPGMNKERKPVSTARMISE